MSDDYTEVTTQGWFSRIGNAFKGIIFGLILFVVAFPLLFWNEGRAVKRTKTLNEGSGVVISVSSDTVVPGNEGKLVHLTGKAMTEETLTDEEFGVSATALKLKRVVEMYQWKESVKTRRKKKVGGKTKTTKTYSYNRTWSSRLIDSSGFKKPEGHQNPAVMPYQSLEKTAQTVTIGAFRLSDSLVARISNFTRLPVDPAQLPPEMAGTVKAAQGAYYIGEGNPSAPQVGDTRITFKAVYPVEISLVAQQVGDTFAPYQSKVGGTIELLKTGVHSAEAMFQAAQESNRILTWVLRAVGFFLMFLGLVMVFKPLSVLADVVPIFGTIVGAGTGIIAFLIAAALSIFTIAVAWIAYRPLLGVPLLIIAIVLAVLLFKRLKAARAAHHAGA